MADLTLRNVKGSPLTNQEVDDNFSNLNDDKVEKSGDTLTGDLAFGDNVKAKFGAGDDLLIFHNGTNSFVKDNGTGNLLLLGNNLKLANTFNTKAYLFAEVNGAVTLYYDDSAKLATTSSGVDVTGTLVADGLTVDGNVELNHTVVDEAGQLYLDGTTNNTGHPVWNLQFRNTVSGVVTDEDAGSIRIDALNTRRRYDMIFATSDNGVEADRLAIDYNGDISFYEDTGTTAKFFWDASSERLGIGNSSPASALDVTGTVTADGLTVDGNGDVNGTLEVGTSSSGILNLMRPSTNYLRANEAGASIAVGVRENLRFFTGQGENEFLTNERIRIANNGDISFYDDSGTSQDFYWDASTSRLGLGTTSPISPLDINIAPDRGLNIQGALSATTYIRSYQGSSSNNIRSLGFQGQQLLFNTGSGTEGSEALRIDSSGNVGIGTTSPQALLHLIGTGEGVDTQKIYISEDSSPRGMFVKYDGLSNDGIIGGLNTSEYDVIKFPRDGTNIRFNTSGSEAMRIDSSGRLGIGTTSPVAELTVGSPSSTNAYSVTYGKVVVADTDVTPATTQAGALDILGTSRAAVGRGPALTFSQNTSQFVDGYDRVIGAIQTELVNSNNLSSHSAMLFYTSDGSTPNTSLTERMRIDNNGNVGIGTTSPSTALDVSGTITSTGATINGMDVGVANGATRYINTHSDAGRLSIHGGASQTGASLYLSGPSYGAGNEAELVASNNVKFVTGGSESMRIDSNGRLGIGTTSPLSDIHIAKSSPVIRMEDTDNDSYGMILYNTASGGLLLRSDHNEQTGTTGSNIIFQTDGSEAARIDSSGRLGIGTTSPAQILEIADSDSPTLRITNTDGTLEADQVIGAIEFKGSDSSADGFDVLGAIKLIATDATPDSELVFYTHKNNASVDDSITERMRIDNNGNVGIGTTSPSTALHVAGSNSPARFSDDGTGFTLDIKHDTSQGITTLEQVNSGGDIKLKAGVSSGLLFFETGGSEAMRIDSSGNLLVGTTATTVGSSSTLDGIALLVDANGGTITAARSGTVSRLNRQGSDGEIINFRRDGSTVGSIGSAGSGSTIEIHGGSTGAYFGSEGILPTNGSGVISDDARDLGSSSFRWQDLYLSGGVYLGGTGSANLLDDYEEGTWTPTTASDATGAISSSEGEYTKIGRLVFVSFVVNVSTNFSGNIIGGLPFTVADINSLSSYHQVGTCITQSSNTVTTVTPENSTEIRFFDNQNVNDAHYLNTTQDLYRVTISYQTT